MKVRIDPEFSKLMPAVDDDGDLEKEILRDGKINEPLTLWSHQQILLDGHRRHRLMAKHPTLKAPPPVVLVMESRQEAHDWIIRHQLSKRNVTEAQRKYLRGKLYSDNKPAQGKPKPDNMSGLQSAQNIGVSEGVSERTIRRDGEFAEALDNATEATSEEVKAAVLSEEVKAGATSLNALAALPSSQRKKAEEHIVNGTVSSVAEAVTKAKPKPARGQPVVDVRRFSKVRTNVGKLVREMTDLKEHAGGAKYHSEIRAHLNEILTTLDDWQKTALKT